MSSMKWPAWTMAVFLITLTLAGCAAPAARVGVEYCATSGVRRERHVAPFMRARPDSGVIAHILNDLSVGRPS